MEGYFGSTKEWIFVVIVFSSVVFGIGAGCHAGCSYVVDHYSVKVEKKP